MSRSTRFCVLVEYKGAPDVAFDQALEVFARRHGMNHFGSGCIMSGKFAGIRDIEYCCGSWLTARVFQDSIRARFKVIKAKLLKEK